MHNKFFLINEAHPTAYSLEQLDPSNGPRPIPPRLLSPPRPLLKKRAFTLPQQEPSALSLSLLSRATPEASPPDAWASPRSPSPAMAGQQPPPPPPGGAEDDFLEHFFAFPSAAPTGAGGGHGHGHGGAAAGLHGGDNHPFPLALSLDAAAEASAKQVSSSSLPSAPPSAASPANFTSRSALTD